jgi:uncharacterized protein
MDKKTLIGKLKDFKKSLEKKIDVNRILFFGSRSNGKSNKDSDVDLIIVSKDFNKKKFRNRAIGFYDYWDIDLPVDFLCYTPEEFAKLSRMVTIVREAKKNGVVI